MMTTVRVERFQIGKPKKASEDLESFLQELTDNGWSLVSVAPLETVLRGALLNQRVVTYLVVVTK